MLNVELGPKRLEVAREMIPAATSVGLLQWAVGAQDLTFSVHPDGGPTVFDNLVGRLRAWFKVLLPQ